MGKPQTDKRVPIVKHENQPPPLFFHFPPPSLLLLTLPPHAGGGGGALSLSLWPGKQAHDRVCSTRTKEEVGSMMIYKKTLVEILSCDPRACLATGAMGKPQSEKRVPIVKHENQPSPLFFRFLPPSLLFLTLSPHAGGGGGALSLSLWPGKRTHDTV